MTERIDSLLQFGSSGRTNPLISEFVPLILEKAIAAVKLHPANCRDYIKCAEAILEDRAIAEVFFYAVQGLHRDLPSTKFLRKRLEILTRQFVRG
jgi:hypothetical protein